MQVEIKTSYEEYARYFNFKKYLATDEIVGSFVLTCINTATGLDSSSVVIESSSLTSPRVKAGLKAGTDGDTHKITVTATTFFGQIFEQELFVKIDDGRIDGDFPIQPNEAIIFANDFVNDLESGDSLSTKTFTIIKKSDNSDVTGSIAKGSAIDGTKVVAKIGSCVNSEIYQAVIKVVTTNGDKFQANFLASCKEL